MDDGRTEVFNGYRVQHSLTSGASKGGLRYAANVDLGEVGALSMWMSWKCALTGLPYGGAKGGVTCNPRELSAGEMERVTRRYTQELIPFIGPQIDIPALLIYGGESNFYHASTAQYVQSRIAGAILHIYEGTDHSPHQWQRERFTRDLLAFAG